MISKLPPKYTFLFLLLFILIANKGEYALSNSAQFYFASTEIVSTTDFILFPSSAVSDDHANLKLGEVSDLESYQWYTDINSYIRS